MPEVHQGAVLSELNWKRDPQNQAHDTEHTTSGGSEPRRTTSRPQRWRRDARAWAALETSWTQAVKGPVAEYKNNEAGPAACRQPVQAFEHQSYVLATSTVWPKHFPPAGTSGPGPRLAPHIAHWSYQCMNCCGQAIPAQANLVEEEVGFYASLPLQILMLMLPLVITQWATANKEGAHFTGKIFVLKGRWE